MPPVRKRSGALRGHFGVPSEECAGGPAHLERTCSRRCVQFISATAANAGRESGDEYHGADHHRPLRRRGRTSDQQHHAEKPTSAAETAWRCAERTLARQRTVSGIVTIYTPRSPIVLIMLIFRRSRSRVLGARPRRACLDGVAVDRRWYATARPSWIAHFPVFSCRGQRNR